MNKNSLNKPNPYHEAKNIQNFGFSLDACQHLEPTILKVFVQDESKDDAFNPKLRNNSKVGYALCRLVQGNGQVELVTWWICNRIEDEKKNFFAEHGTYSGIFKPTIEEYKKRLCKAEEDFNERVSFMINPHFDSYVKSGREFV